MRKFKTHSPLLPALETAFCGACWSDSRVHDAKPEVSAICNRCNLEIATDAHVFWQCSANAQIESEVMTNSDFVIQNAIKN